LWWQDVDLEAAEVLVGYNVVDAKACRAATSGSAPRAGTATIGRSRSMAEPSRCSRNTAQCEARAREWGGRLAPDAYV
jgi:hypothetical protein